MKRRIHRLESQKEEIIMAEDKNVHAQQKSPFVGLWEDQMKRVESFYQELASMEAKNAEQARMAIDEGAKLMKETIEYGLKLSAEWRKVALDTTRRAAELVPPKV
jgi:hypothetical protein